MCKNNAIFAVIMFKNVVKYLITVVLSVVFVFVATGFNYVNYCCSQCAEEGVEALFDEPCHSEHGHSCCNNSHATNKMHDGFNAEHHQDQCTLQYLRVDDSVFSGSSLNVGEPISFVLAYLISSFDFSTSVYVASSNHLLDDPLLLTGREVLSSGCVLLI